MKLSLLSLNKGRDVAGQNLSSWTKTQPQRTQDRVAKSRAFSNGSKQGSVESNTSKPRQLAPNGRAREVNADKFANRDFLLSVLDSSATKRDAKAYLQRFTPPNGSTTVRPNFARAETPRISCGVNLGTFYAPTRAVGDSPKFIQHPEMGSISPAMVAQLHIALVKIRAPQTMTDEVLNGIGRTLSQLAKLGLTSTVVVDCAEEPSNTETSLVAGWKDKMIEQTDRIIAAIDSHGQPGARKIDSLIGLSEKTEDSMESSKLVKGRTQVTNRKLLMTPLRRGVIPVIPALGYTDTNQQAAPARADDIVLALTREFAGFQALPLPDEDPKLVAEMLQALRKEVSVDRLILLDPLGGVPSNDRPNGIHVFLNMEQEFSDVKDDLLSFPSQQDLSDTTFSPVTSDPARGNPFSKLTESNIGSPSSASDEIRALDTHTGISSNMIHLANLELVRRFLALLPPSSSALITSPEEVANSGKQKDVPFQAIGVGTRRKRNPLIHNLLTDKPVFSSSLPTGRISSTSIAGIPASQPSPRISPTTFAKRGMSVTVFPDPKISPWQPPITGQPYLSLTDPRIDLPRLVHLIDDSFNRKLDTEAYLKRVNDRIAGVIIAGEYEGGALLTWELPPGVPDDGSDASRARMVPYLDKFAVLKRSQGAGGVADIVFKSMVRDCFPNGVCWRSRRDNPVNKWYFERSRGTWKMPGTNWTMFWTTPGLNREENRQIFDDYEAVCRSIQPTWADAKMVID